MTHLTHIPRLTHVTCLTHVTHLTHVTCLTHIPRLNHATHLTHITCLTFVTRLTHITHLTHVTRLTRVNRVNLVTDSTRLTRVAHFRINFGLFLHISHRVAYAHQQTRYEAALGTDYDPWKRGLEEARLRTLWLLEVKWKIVLRGQIYLGQLRAG